MTPDKITIHCSATQNGRDVSLETIRGWHQRRGFQDIGYHYVIGVDGTIRQGRNALETGAHVQEHNEGNLGICLVGNDKFSGPQLWSMKDLVGRLCAVHKIPMWEIYTHYLFDTAIKQGKTCPNMTIQRLLAWIMTADERAIKEYILE